MRKKYTRKNPFTKKGNNYHKYRNCPICDMFVSNLPEHLNGFHKKRNKEERNRILLQIKTSEGE